MVISEKWGSGGYSSLRSYRVFAHKNEKTDKCSFVVGKVDLGYAPLYFRKQSHDCCNTYPKGKVR